MKKLLKIYATELLALYFANQIASGLVFQDKLTGLLITAAALAIATTLIRPIINILILPLSLATLGLFKFFSHAITLYLVDLALQQFSIVGFYFPGLHSQYLDLPMISFGSGPLSYIAFSVLISIITFVINWIIH
jgi:uncharacterized membrane protein YvlD (DUF360 family)